MELNDSKIDHAIIHLIKPIAYDKDLTLRLSFKEYSVVFDLNCVVVRANDNSQFIIIPYSNIRSADLYQSRNLKELN